MASDVLGSRPSRPLLTLGRVDVVRVQVGHRASPDTRPYQQFLLDLPVPEPEGDGAVRLDEDRVLSALEPVLYVGGGPRHYSLHQHRWHTSWGASPGALEIGLLVTTGPATAEVSRASSDTVTRAFRDLLDAADAPPGRPTSRDEAILRARHSASTAFGLATEALSLSAEEHDPSRNSWSLLLRTGTEDEYDVVVGLVDGYGGSVRVRHGRRTEVADAVGSE